MNSIVFISQLDNKSQTSWLTCLQKNMPTETILLPAQISDNDIQNVDIAIVANPDPKILAKFPNLIWIQSLWAGVESLLKEKIPETVKVVRLIDPQLTNTMAEAAMAWTLYLHRNMPEYALQQKQSHWNQLPYMPANKVRVGVLGLGELGLAAVTSLQKLNYQVRGWSRTTKQINNIKTYSGCHGLEKIIGNSDILISLLPLTPETFHLLNRSLLSKLPVGAKVINFSRGAIIDTVGLLQLIDSKHIAHAVLDVFEQEPLNKKDPIWHNPNITVLPHISAPTDIHSSIKVASENIVNYRKNQIIPSSVNRALGY